MKNNRHCAMILQFMRDNGGITPGQAMDELGCYRLGARIWDLRHKYGYNIKTEMVQKRNRYGVMVSFAKYILIEEAA